MARTKQCARANPPSFSSSPSPSPSPSPTLPPPPPLIKMSVPATTLPSPSLPPLPPILSRASTPAVKSVPQIVVGPPLPKKLAYLGPFIKGQIGTIFFSLDKPRNYMEILHSYSLIIQSFHLRRKHEVANCKYIIVDPLGNSWSSPEVFTQWRICVENGEAEELDLTKVRLAITRFGNTFKLCTSDKKSKYTSQTHIIPSLELAEEDPREKKDPDYVPPKDSNEELE